MTRPLWQIANDLTRLRQEKKAARIGGLARLPEMMRPSTEQSGAQ